MKNKHFLIALLIFMVGMGIFHYFEKKGPKVENLDEMKDRDKKISEWNDGKLAPDFDIELLNGQNFSLSEHIGKKVIILYFTASWCPPCKIMVPELKHLYKEYEKKPFTMVALFVDKKKEDVEKTVKKYGPPFTSIAAWINKELAEKYEVPGLPTFVVIGKDGKTLFYKTGMIRNVDITLKPLIEKELKRGGWNVSFKLSIGE